ncbi:MAG: hypothetical protein AABX01_08020 [Candidatus Micrarchaeota archaeon]|mgnify:CR=1 FL=1
MQKGQTAIDYVMLIGAAVTFTIIVTLAIRTPLVSSGEQVDIKAADLIATQQAYATSVPTELVIPSAPVPPDVQYGCIPGDSCTGPSSYCSGNSVCTGYACDSSGQCTPSGLSCSSSCGSTVCIPPLVGVPCDNSCSGSPATCGTCVPSCAIPPHTCSVVAFPNSYSGPFIANVTVTIQNIEPGDAAVNIKCNPSDPGIPSAINIATSTASRLCNFARVGSQTTTQVVGELGGSNPFSCQADVTTNPLNLQSDITLCDFFLCSVNAKPSIYDLTINTLYDQSPPIIPVFSPSTSCYTGTDACLYSPCRVRGSQSGDNVCALIEDWSDYDWDDFQFSSNLFDLPNGDQLVSVRHEGCSGAATDQLNITFNFPTEKYVRLAGTPTVQYSANPSFVVWPACAGHTREVMNYYISSDGSDASNTPPIWSAFLSDPVAIGVGQSVTNFNLAPIVTDPQGQSFEFILVDENASVIDCTVAGSTLQCGPALAHGTSSLTIAAIDAGGLWSTSKRTITVGPKLTLPALMTISKGASKQEDLWAWTYDPEYVDNMMNYTITLPPNPAIASCTIAGDATTGTDRILRCNGFIWGKTAVMVKVINPLNVSAQDYLPIIVS